MAKTQGGFTHCGAGSKNTIMRVRCVSNWGWWLIGLLGLGAAGYVGGFALHAHKVQGKPLDAGALPHPLFWREVRALVVDGARFAQLRAQQQLGGGGGGTGGYKPVSSGESGGGPGPVGVGQPTPGPVAAAAPAAKAAGGGAAGGAAEEEGEEQEGGDESDDDDDEVVE
eukprot:COSAG04_NODE_737_length_10702_cov_11.388664_10_plen_169_part_00